MEVHQKNKKNSIQSCSSSNLQSQLSNKKRELPITNYRSYVQELLEEFENGNYTSRDKQIKKTRKPQNNVNRKQRTVAKKIVSCLFQMNFDHPDIRDFLKNCIKQRNATVKFFAQFVIFLHLKKKRLIFKQILMENQNQQKLNRKLESLKCDDERMAFLRLWIRMEQSFEPSSEKESIKAVYKDRTGLMKFCRGNESKTEVKGVAIDRTQKAKNWSNQYLQNRLERRIKIIKEKLEDDYESPCSFIESEINNNDFKMSPIYEDEMFDIDRFWSTEQLSKQYNEDSSAQMKQESPQSSDQEGYLSHYLF